MTIATITAGVRIDVALVPLHQVAQVVRIMVAVESQSEVFPSLRQYSWVELEIPPKLIERFADGWLAQRAPKPKTLW